MKPILLLIALLPLDLAAQGVKILVPTAVNEPIPGGYGSQWISVLTMHNSGTGSAGVDATDPLCVTERCHFFSLLQPGKTGVVQPARNGMAFGGPGAFVWGTQATVQQLRFRLRIQDLSRQSSTWGTEIPVILETEALTAKAQFLDVPTDARFRQTLRIYDFDARENAELAVRIFDADGGVLASRNVILFRGSGPFGLLPAQIQLHQPTDWVMDAVLPAVVRVEVEPVTPGLRFWAMINITNNETQHVTLISPQ